MTAKIQNAPAAAPAETGWFDSMQACSQAWFAAASAVARAQASALEAEAEMMGVFTRLWLVDAPAMLSPRLIYRAANPMLQLLNTQLLGPRLPALPE